MELLAKLKESTRTSSRTALSRTVVLFTREEMKSAAGLLGLSGGFGGPRAGSWPACVGKGGVNLGRQAVARGADGIKRRDRVPKGLVSGQRMEGCAQGTYGRWRLVPGRAWPR